VRVLLADDQRLIREALGTLLALLACPLVQCGPRPAPVPRLPRPGVINGRWAVGGCWLCLAAAGALGHPGVVDEMTKSGAGADGAEGAAAGDPRVALVTGANKGIGLHIARQAQRGLLVLVGSRDVERGGRAAVAELVGEGLDVRLLVLDVTDEASVAAAAEQVGADPGRLDVLVNNAGIASGLAPTSEVQVTDLRRTYETNVFGVVAVTNALLPLLRRSPAPRIVNVSSGLGSLTMLSDPGFPFAELNNAAYQSSKMALNAFGALRQGAARGGGEGQRGQPRPPGHRAQRRADDPRGGCPPRPRRPTWVQDLSLRPGR
jgi:NADP-dependent 3-hydroxy acid dehydrogenase YdfG